MVRIEDGKGKNGFAEVNSEQQLVTLAVVETEIEHRSAENGTAFSWDSTELNIDATDTMLFLKNTGDAALHIDRIVINGSDVICFWEVRIGDATTTPAGGAVVTGVNLNRIFSAKTADVIARSDETAVAAGDVIFRVKTPLDNTVILSAPGVILGKNHYIQVDQVTESDSGSVTITGHFA